MIDIKELKLKVKGWDQQDESMRTQRPRQIWVWAQPIQKVIYSPPPTTFRPRPAAKLEEMGSERGQKDRRKEGRSMGEVKPTHRRLTHTQMHTQLVWHPRAFGFRFSLNVSMDFRPYFEWRRFDTKRERFTLMWWYLMRSLCRRALIQGLDVKFHF